MSPQEMIAAGTGSAATCAAKLVIFGLVPPCLLAWLLVAKLGCL